MPIQIIAELSTNHGGDVGLAEAMLVAAAEAGADYVKTQAYCPEKINPRDPQYRWLYQSYLSEAAHARLVEAAAHQCVKYLSTPFCADSLAMLRRLGLRAFKIASTESLNRWWHRLDGEHWFVSYPWGRKTDEIVPHEWLTALAAIPLYPTPLECVERATLLDGWSDHCEGLSACYRALVLGAKVVEVHFKIDGLGRNCAWDKTAADIRRLRAFADDVETMREGVATRFRTRWTA